MSLNYQCESAYRNRVYFSERSLQNQIVILNKVKDLPVTGANRYLEILRYAQKDRMEGFAKSSQNNSATQV